MTLNTFPSSAAIATGFTGGNTNLPGNLSRRQAPTPKGTHMGALVNLVLGGVVGVGIVAGFWALVDMVSDLNGRGHRRLH